MAGAVMSDEFRSELYQASRIKRRRATQDEVRERRRGLWEIVAEGAPMTVRQVFYQATVRGIVDKTENDYNKVQTDLVFLRKSGAMPYGWLADSTRWQRKPETYSSVEHALAETAKFYRKALWTNIDAHVEVWLEKDALAGVIYPITSEYDVPLMVTRGYASLSFLHNAAEEIKSFEKPTYIYHLGDYDPSGVDAQRKVKETLREMAPESDIFFHAVAVSRSQIEAWDLPTRPTKSSDTRAKTFGDISVELDAIAPDMLRALVRACLERHLPADQLQILKVAEQSEREVIKAFVSGGS